MCFFKLNAIFQKIFILCIYLAAAYLPTPGLEPASPALAGRFFTAEPPGKPQGRVDTVTLAGILC